MRLFIYARLHDEGSTDNIEFVRASLTIKSPEEDKLQFEILKNWFQNLREAVDDYKARQEYDNHVANDGPIRRRL